MKSKTKKGDEIREYFIEIEELLNEYKNLIIDQLEKQINNKTIIKTKHQKKIIYIIKASEEYDSLYKLGRTKDIK